MNNLIDMFSLPYERIFHLICFVFSANAQFWHSKIFEHLTGYTLVIQNQRNLQTQINNKQKQIDDLHKASRKHFKRIEALKAERTALYNQKNALQPKFTEIDTKIESIKSVNETGNSQNEILFILGNAISGAPIIIGTNQLPKPPIIAGITIKKIMIKPWPVTKTLYKW